MFAAKAVKAFLNQSIYKETTATYYLSKIQNFFSSKRFIIYQFMLTHMSDEDRFNLTGKLCQEVCSE